MLFGYKKLTFDNNASEIKLKIENQIITEVNQTKFLGAMIDQKFTWPHHITYIYAKISKSLYILNRLRNKLNSESLSSIYYSLVYSHLSYCNILWGGASKSFIHDLFLLQQKAIQIVCKTYYLSHTDTLFKNMNLLKLTDINTYLTCLFIFKYLNKQLPAVCNCFLLLTIPNSAPIT